MEKWQIEAFRELRESREWGALKKEIEMLQNREVMIMKREEDLNKILRAQGGFSLLETLKNNIEGV